MTDTGYKKGDCMATSNQSKRAWVTGAAQGLGEGVARRLARDGWSVLLTDINPEVEATARKLTSEFKLAAGKMLHMVADVADVDQTEKAAALAVKHFGGLDLAVANAGIGGVEIELIDLEPQDFDRIVAVNLRGVYLVCRAAGRIMRAARSGSLITISSIFGQEPYPRVATYSATKAGVIALTQALALELAPYGIRINSIAPGYMATEMQWAGLRARAANAGITFEEERQRVVKLVPLGRHGTGDDVGAAVAFLASDEASYITGATLGVTGGVVRR
jgi:NAD(P)-dependent dehydrogenase (short-subunit alcohol dehydrogenase family)